MKRVPQTVGAISTNRDLSRKCLHKLQAICGHRSTLPSSSIVSSQIAKVGRGPIAVGPIADVWQANYLTGKVSIRCLKVPLDGDQAFKKVCSIPRLYCVCSKTSACIVVILRSDRHMEAVKTSEHCPFYRSHDGSLANHLGVDVEWNSDRVRSENSGYESDQPGGSFLVITPDR